MHKVLILAQYQIRLLFRNMRGIALALLLPVIMFLIFSNLLGKSFNTGSSISIVEYLVPAYIPIIIINAVTVMFGQYYILYKEQGNLLKYKLLGMNSIQVAVSIYLSTLVFQLVATVILVVSAFLAKGISIPFNNLFSVILAIAIINIFEFAIAFILISFINKSTMYQPISLILFYYQMFLGGLTFPPEMFSKTLKQIVYITNPIIYGLEIMRGVWTEGKSIFIFHKQIIILISVSFMLIIIALLYEKLREKKYLLLSTHNVQEKLSR